jgi:V/A-type H+-transporting ATPase subunit I
MKETTSDVQKLLRSADFEQVHFENMKGTAEELIEQYRRQLNDATKQLQQEKDNARSLAKDLLKLQILYDYHRNLLDREQTRTAAPATECTVVLEGWVRNKDFGRLEKTVGKFDASSLSRIEPAEDEEIPVEIENNNAVKPFEVITRLYGMPMHFEVDPTVFLAPFFALFFGLCLTDAGYGLIMIAGSVYFIKKMQGDKKFGYLFLICSILTVICGAITGGWFGDAIQLINVPWLNKFRQAFLRYGFDPTASPMTFFKVSLAIGYFQLMFGIAVAFVAKLIRKQIFAAICDHLTWLVMLNCLVAFGFGNSGIFLTPEQGRIFLMIAGVPAATIFLFSHREGGIVARLGMGFYNLASTMFYIGDVLSYVRLMALGMVTAGFAMAINQMAMMAAGKFGFFGPILAVAVLIFMHAFNLAISALGSFVHSLRLQYVEFFPKFFEGGGKLFRPFAQQYKHVYISNEVND